MAKKMIVKNDPTTHGGFVMTAWGEDAPVPFKIDGKPVACVGDRVYCPKKGHRAIPSSLKACGDPVVEHCGKEIAYEGCLCSCGCRVMSAGQSLATYSSDSEPPHPVVVLIQERKAREAAAAAMAAASGAGVQGAGETKEKWIAFKLGDVCSCEGLSCVALFDDGSEMEGEFDAANKVTFEGVSGVNVMRVELKFENPEVNSSFAELLLKRMEGSNHG